MIEKTNISTSPATRESKLRKLKETLSMLQKDYQTYQDYLKRIEKKYSYLRDNLARIDLSAYEEMTEEYEIERNTILNNQHALLLAIDRTKLDILTLAYETDSVKIEHSIKGGTFISIFTSPKKELDVSETHPIKLNSRDNILGFRLVLQTKEKR
jgi:predicted RNase H-like nuclease (RuvC/YqgF family)